MMMSVSGQGCFRRGLTPVLGLTSTRMAVLLACLAGAWGASGQEPTPKPSEPDLKAKVRRYFDEGIRHYNVGQYEEAIAAFKEGYLQTNVAEFLYNIAQSYRLEGDRGCQQALRFYQSFLRMEPSRAEKLGVPAVVEDMARCAERQPAPPPELAALVHLPSGPMAKVKPPTPYVWLPKALLYGGLAVGAAGGALIVWAQADYTSLKNSQCAPFCDPARWSGAEHRREAGVGLAIGGGVAAASGLVWGLLSPKAPVQMSVSSSPWSVGLAWSAAP
jgi:hypothetical protein